MVSEFISLDGVSRRLVGPGGDIYVYGSVSLAQPLLAAGQSEREL